MRSRIDPVEKLARTVRLYHQLLLEPFTANKQFSIRVIEGLNNKARRHSEKSLGLSDVQDRRLCLHHVLGRLPEPIPHRFF